VENDHARFERERIPNGGVGMSMMSYGGGRGGDMDASVAVARRLINRKYHIY
jgi:hypothetical protein